MSRDERAAVPGPTEPPAGAQVHSLPDGPAGGDGLTARQRLVLETIRDSVERRGYPPSMREIGEAVGLTSPSSVAHQLTTLERKGLLKRERDQLDKRKVMLRMTEAGQAAVAKAPALLQDSFVRAFNRLEDWEQTLILSSLQRVSEMMNATELDAAPLLDSSNAQVIDKTDS
jgi:DNA-binding MarR family transcriptional regulator